MQQQTAFDRITWPVRTDRLVLRPARPEDAMALYAVRSQEQVSRFLTRWPREEQEWREQFADPAWLAACLVIEHGDRPVGDLMVRIQDPYAQAEVVEQARGVEAELGWVLDPAYAGRGLATEAVQAVIGLCFDGLGLRRVVAHCFAENAPSWRLMERVGMRRESHSVRDALHRELGWRDGYTYALLAEEWAGSAAG